MTTRLLVCVSFVARYEKDTKDLHGQGDSGGGFGLIVGEHFAADLSKLGFAAVEVRL